MNLELTDEEFETLKEIFFDWGSDCPYTDYIKYHALGEKLGILEPLIPLTEEQLKRRQEFADKMKPILEATNHLLAKAILNSIKIGSDLKIRLPKDYNVNG